MSIKKYKIYDCIPFFNELDILELRLELLYDYVDYFVISECDSTFSGENKPFYFDDNKEKYKKYSDKIIHLKHYKTKDYLILENNYNGEKKIIYDKIINRLSFMIKSPKTDYGQPHWCRDFFHKELTMLGLDICKPDDIILFGDCDEIPEPSKLIFDGDAYVLNQKNMMYYLNTENKTNNWHGTLIIKYSNLIDGSCMFTRDSRMSFKKIDSAGWHLSWMGGKERMLQKLQSWGHQEYNNQYFKNQISSNFNSNTDILDRNIVIKSDDMKNIYSEKIVSFVENKFPYLINTL